jgi:hypothetical protein
MIGSAAVPTAEILLPRLTASHDWPVAPYKITPGSIDKVTLVSAVNGVVQPIVVEVKGAPEVGAVNPPSQPTLTRPFIE